MENTARATEKWGPTEWIVRGVWGGTPPGNFEILHALKCVLGAPEALFRACTQYIYTCKLPSSISGFRWKNTTHGAVASPPPVGGTDSDVYRIAGKFGGH